MNIKQLITVNISEVPTIELKTWQDGWKTEKVLTNVAIGKEGSTMTKREGDLKTPLGLFKLGPAFGTISAKTNYPYLEITDNSYWIDDPISPYYNKWVEIGEENTFYKIKTKEINWNSAEHLIDYPEYKLGFIIEYNTENQYDELNKGNNKGSAIFLHIKQQDHTAGCIATTEENIKYILNWLAPESNPYILIKTN